MDPVSSKVDLRTLVPYGVGAIASGAKSVPLTAFLMLYYNQVVGLSAIAVSSVLMISLIFDALCDPLIGQISDNFRSRWGRRLPFMYASAVPVMVLFTMLWIPPPGWSEWALTAYLAACVIGVRLCDSFFDLPHAALVPELSSDYDERTKLFTVRSIFEAIGGIGISLLAYNVFMKENPDGTGGLLSAEGYPVFAWFTGLVIFAAIMVCTAGLHRRLSHPMLPAVRKVHLGTMFREIAATLNSRSLAVLVLSAIFISIGSGIGSALSIYWMLYLYQFSQAEVSLLFVPVMLGILLSCAAPLIASKMGKRNAAIALCWVYMFAASVPVLARILDIVPPASPTLFGLVIFQTAIGPAAITMVLIMLSSMISDLTEEAEVRTGRRSEGLLLAANSLVRKATMGFGTLGAGIILTAVSFPQGAERQDVPDNVMTNMALLYLAVKFLLFAATTMSFLLYRYNRQTHEANLQTLAGKAPQQGSIAGQSSMPTGGVTSERSPLIDRTQTTQTL